MVRRVDEAVGPPAPAGAKDQVVTRFLNSGVRLDAVAWGQRVGEEWEEWAGQVRCGTECECE
jgi:hypothetical protein